MCDAFEAILFVTATTDDEESQSYPLFNKLFIQSEENINLQLFFCIICGREWARVLKSSLRQRAMFVHCR
jgi:hypothetical protein